MVKTIGHYNKTEQQVTQLGCLKHGVKIIALPGLVKRNGLLLHQTSTLWTILYGQFLRVKPALKPSSSIEALKLKLMKTWEKIPMEIVHASINDFSRRLCIVVKAKGKHFEC